MRALVVVLTLVLLVSAHPLSAGQDEASITLRHARDGDAAQVTLREASGRWGSVYQFPRTYDWEGPVRDFTTTFGDARRAYTVHVETDGCWCTGDGRLDVEVGSHLVMGRHVDQVQGPYREQVTPGHERRYTQHVLNQYHNGYVEPALALQGRTIAPGDAFRVLAPPNPASEPMWRTWIDFSVAGWTDLDGERLFLVEGLDRWQRDHYRLYYDGETPFPVHVNWTYMDERWTETTLVSWTDGAGEILHDETYAPAEWPLRQSDAPRATFTRDGPAEDFLPGFPLSKAVAAARADPRVSTWLAARPHAFVLIGEGTHGFHGAAPSWNITFGGRDGFEAEEEDRLLAHVVLDPVLGRAIVAEVTPAFPLGDYNYGYSALDGRTYACGAASTAAAEAAHSGADLSQAARRVYFHVYGGEVVCSTTLTTHLDGHGGDSERTRQFTARLSGHMGWVTSTFDTRTEAEHTYEWPWPASWLPLPERPRV